MAEISVDEVKLLPVRRDKQVQSITKLIGGSYSSGGGGTAIPVSGNADTLDGHDSTYFAPIDSPIFTTQITTPKIYGSGAYAGSLTIAGTSHASASTGRIFVNPLGGSLIIGGSTSPTAICQIVGPTTWNGRPTLLINSDTGLPWAYTDVDIVIATKTGTTSSGLTFYSSVASGDSAINFSTALNAAGRKGYIRFNHSSKAMSFFADTGVQVIISPSYVSFANSIGTATFFSGFAGSGWQLENATGGYKLTVDDLIVRKSLTAYELRINKISSVGGSIIVSAANGKVAILLGSTSPYTMCFDSDGGNKPIEFQIGDYIRAQIWNGRGIASFVGLVTDVHQSITTNQNYIVVTTVSGTPWVGMELVQIGHNSDANRQNVIYLTATDDGAPYMDMLTGVNAGSFADKQVLRIGKLTGVTDPTYGALTGYGLYSQNVYLTGWIKATAGYIGGWTIDATTIFSGTKHATDYWSTTGISLVNDGSLHSPNFYINDDGEVGMRGKYFIYSYNGVSNDIILSHDAEAGTVQGTFTKLKTITLGSYVRASGLTLRVRFSMMSTSPETAHARIYKNGVAVGTDHSDSSGVYVLKSQDIGGWGPGDTIELWAYTTNGGGGIVAYVKEFRICGVHSIAVNEITGTNS